MCQNLLFDLKRIIKQEKVKFLCEISRKYKFYLGNILPTKTNRKRRWQNMNDNTR